MCLLNEQPDTRFHNFIIIITSVNYLLNYDIIYALQASVLQTVQSVTEEVYQVSIEQMSICRHTASSYLQSCYICHFN